MAHSSAPPLLAALLLALTGCATYRPDPPDLQARPAASLVELAPAQAGQGPLSLAGIGALAIAHNPELVAVRADHGIAQAQLDAAGELPNPTLSGSFASVISGPGALPALALGLGQDIKALIVRPAKVASARAQLQSVDAAVLWQEWQTASKAELTALELVTARRQLALAQQTVTLWTTHVEHLHNAQQRGDVSLPAFTLDNTLLADARSQAAALETLALARQQELDGLLGLSSAVQLDIAAPDDVQPLPASTITARQEHLVDFRPDLIALEAGYQAQEQQVRASVLSQFPALTLGGNYGRDTGNVKTAGVDVSMELPLFNHHQAAVGLEQATRSKLKAEFEARQRAARNELTSLLGQQALLVRQRDERRQQMAQSAALLPALQRAYARGDIDAHSYLDTLSAQNSKAQDLIGLDAALAASNLAAETLCGLGMPQMQRVQPTPTSTGDRP